jgi:peptide/nickel transport system substrate-binding protein
MTKNIKSVVGFFLSVGLCILAASGGVSSAVTLRTSTVSDPIGMDPAHAAHTSDTYITGNIFQGLVTFDFTADPPYPVIPVLAKEYQVSEDAKVITLRLHQGVQFHHNYGELTSEDVVFSLERHRDPKVASRASPQYADVVNVTAVDKYTVRIELKISSAFSLLRNLAYMNSYILSKKAVTELGDKIKTFPVGTGPFYFDKWSPGEKTVIKKFEQYWRTPPKIDQIEFWIIPEETVALGALDKGDLDVVALTQLGSYERAKTLKNAYIDAAKAGARIYIYYINHKLKPMDDVRVRRALYHAIDMKAICKRIGPQVGYFPSPIAPLAFSATDEFWNYEYDVDKAKKLLAEAGYPNGFDLNMIYLRSDLYEPIAMEVQSYLKKIVDVNLQLIERAVYYKTLKRYKHHLAGWGLARYVPFLFAERYISGAVRNYAQYSNPKVDEAITKAKTARTEEESKKYWREFQRLVTQDAVNIWVANGKSMAAMRKNVKGVTIKPTPGLMLHEKAYFE